MEKILFISKPHQISALFNQLQGKVELILADSLRVAQKSILENRPRLVFAQADLPGFEVLNLLSWLKDQDLDLPVYVFAARGSVEEAKRVMEAGAKDYWVGGLNPDKVKVVVEDLLQRPEPPKLNTERAELPQIIGEHPKIKAVLALAERVARSKASVLISGESGTGKELFARFIHQKSGRKGRFVAVNCAALPEHLLESELFGHEKGAFTGAIARKLGKFELAHHGTILLDEITEMDLNLQAKLLRVLQEQELERVGGTETVRIDVRVLATTNRDVQKHIEQGKFREDLFYRLNVIPLKIPPLRERGNDVLLLAEFFMLKFCKAYGLDVKRISSQAKKWLLEYHWPGNVRELQNLMERAVLLAQGNEIGLEHFLLSEEEILTLVQNPNEHAGQAKTDQIDLNTVTSLAEMEKQMILKSLKLTGGNRSQASKLLGISVRTLRNKLNEYKKQGLILP